MNNDLHNTLLSSKAADSLRMELQIAKYFQNRNWRAQLGVYYPDPDTKKDREIDVFCRHLLDRPRRHKGTGAPIINLHVICECKSLSAYNILFIEGERERHVDDRLVNHWSGYEKNIREMIDSISGKPPYLDSDIRKLYRYFSDRAYPPPEEREISFLLRLYPPPNGFTATSFRETKGHDEAERTASPLWGAIRSVISATKAAQFRSEQTTRSYTSERNPHMDEPSVLIKQDAFLFDAELMRRVLFHPIVFCRSRLFKLTEDDIEEVDTVRLIVSNFDFSSRYVDIVRFDAAKSYIEGMISHFETTAESAVRKTWNRLSLANWHPGQASADLARAAGLRKLIRVTRKSRRATNVP
jgi:hypothetical protein